MSSSRDLSSFIGVPGICLAISTASRHVVAARAAPAEAGAEHQPMHLALVGRQTRGGDRSPQAPLRRSALPVQTSHFSARVERGGVHRLEADVVLVRIGVDRLDLLGGAGDARPWRRRCLLPTKACFPRSGLPRATWRSISTRPWRSRPSSHTIGSASSAVLACHQVSATTATALSSTCTTFLTPFMPATFGGVEALHLAAEHRAILDRGVQHARHLEVDASTSSCRRPCRRYRGASAACRRSSSPSDPSASASPAPRAWTRLPRPCRRSWCGSTPCA